MVVTTHLELNCTDTRRFPSAVHLRAALSLLCEANGTTVHATTVNQPVPTGCDVVCFRVEKLPSTGPYRFWRHHNGYIQCAPKDKRPHAMPGWGCRASAKKRRPGRHQPGRALPVRMHTWLCWAISCLPCGGDQECMHICGVEDCLMASHIRFGSKLDNRADRDYHMTEGVGHVRPDRAGINGLVPPQQPLPAPPGPKIQKKKVAARSRAL